VLLLLLGNIENVIPTVVCPAMVIAKTGSSNGGITNRTAKAAVRNKSKLNWKWNAISLSSLAHFLAIQILYLRLYFHLHLLDASPFRSCIINERCEHFSRVIDTAQNKHKAKSGDWLSSTLKFRVKNGFQVSINFLLNYNKKIDIKRLGIKRLDRLKKK